MEKGVVFSIEEFAINDGPGIRKTVFLKGCPLRCAWCHNPEGLSPEPQTMHGVDGDRICGETYSSAELAQLLLKDRSYYDMTGGGVTFTGGEPTMQAAFLLEVLDALQGKVHTAMETSGFCSEKIFRALLEKLDFILYDVKIVDPAMHKLYTGVDNAPILRNLRILCDSGKPFVVRIPLIPGVNDSLENMQATKALLSNAGNLQRVELLRYHKTAGAKYPRVDLSYDPPFDQDAVPQVFDVFEKTLVL